MNTYVAIIGGKAVLTFRAVDDDQAHAMIDDQEGSVRSDLKVLVDMDGKPLWDGKSAVQVREATAEQPQMPKVAAGCESGGKPRRAAAVLG